MVMATTAIYSVTEKFIDKCDPEDPEYQRDLIRPVEIKEDVKLMEQRKRVSIILKSKTFCKELEEVIRKQCHNLGLFDTKSSSLTVNYISRQLLLASTPKKTTSVIGVGVSTNGIIPINDLRDGLNKVYGHNEYQMRCKMAAVHRLMDMFSWCNGSTHYITARVSKDTDGFLIKPCGLFFHEITASSLITIDLKGNVIHPGSTVLLADNSRWLVHSAIHATRPDISCLIFLRTPAALCVSGSTNGLLPICSDSIMLGEVSSFEPNLDTIDIESSKDVARLQTDIYKVFGPSKKILLIPNHGIFIGGITVEETWFLVQRVQSACEVQELLYKLDVNELVLPEKEVVSDLKNVWHHYSETTSVGDEKSQNLQSQQVYMNKYRIGLLEFEAMMRHLDNSGYRSGYFYQTLNIFKSSELDTHVSKYPDVEIPPASTFSAYDAAQTELYPSDIQPPGSIRQDLLNTTWFNTPNSYKLDNTYKDGPSISEDTMKSETSSQKHRTTRWVSVNPQESKSVIPHHPVTPGAYISITRPEFASAPVSPYRSTVKGIDPKELKAKQKKVKDKYYYDTNTAGPQSSLLDGLTWDEARRVRDEGLTKFLGKAPSFGDEPLFTAASKGIIQRDHTNHAVVLEGVFKPSNPFTDTDQDLIDYREEINRKNHPELYKVEETVPTELLSEEICPTNVELDCSIMHLPSIPLDTSIVNASTITNNVHNIGDLGMTSDSDCPVEPSPIRATQTVSLHATITSEASGADFSHDDTEKEGKHGKEKKKKKSFKSIFSKKKKKDDKK